MRRSRKGRGAAGETRVGLAAGARRVAIVVAALAIGAAAWVPLLHRFFRPTDAEVARPAESPIARGMLKEQLGVWEDEGRRKDLLARMRRTNPEWDFMGRTFVAMALVNEALRDPASAERYLAVVDRIVDDTEALIDEHGPEYFLLPYALRGAWQ